MFILKYYVFLIWNYNIFLLGLPWNVIFSSIDISVALPTFKPMKAGNSKSCINLAHRLCFSGFTNFNFLWLRCLWLNLYYIFKTSDYTEVLTVEVISKARMYIYICPSLGTGRFSAQISIHNFLVSIKTQKNRGKISVLGRTFV